MLNTALCMFCSIVFKGYNWPGSISWRSQLHVCRGDAGQLANYWCWIKGWHMVVTLPFTESRIHLDSPVTRAHFQRENTFLPSEEYCLCLACRTIQEFVQLWCLKSDFLQIFLICLNHLTLQAITQLCSTNFSLTLLKSQSIYGLFPPIIIKQVSAFIPCLLAEPIALLGKWSLSQTEIET